MVWLGVPSRSVQQVGWTEALPIRFRASRSGKRNLLPQAFIYLALGGIRFPTPPHTPLLPVSIFAMKLIMILVMCGWAACADRAGADEAPTKAVARLMRELKEGDTKTRLAAAQMLARLSPSELRPALPTLVQATKDKHARVRGLSLYTLKQ